MMGAARGADAEKPVHRVTLPAFEMSKTEVTFGQYQACVAAGACRPAHVLDGECRVYLDSNWQKGNLPAAFSGDGQPVVCVELDQAKTFARWAGGRLPSEAEWEYAARGAGQERAYPWGDAEPSCRRAVTMDVERGCGHDATWPACSKPEGTTEQGLCDMAGNAEEWTADAWHASYEGAPADGSVWEGRSGSSIITRGGSWMYGGDSLRASSRRFEYATELRATLGFRVARSGR